MNHIPFQNLASLARFYEYKIPFKGGIIRYDPECGASKGCFVDCNGNECTYMATWRDDGQAITFELYGKPKQSDSWIAVGFSDDTEMVIPS